MSRFIALFLLYLLLALNPALAANWYVSSAGYTAVAQWAATHTYTVGSYVRQLTAPAVDNERVFKATACTTCISGGTEPTWVITAGANTTDGGVTWTEVTGLESEQSAGNWKAPAARVNAFPSGRITNGDQIFVSQDHAETQASLMNFGLTGQESFFCVNRLTGSIPPVSADLTTGASVAVTGNNNLSIGTSVSAVYYIRGISFSAGAATDNASINVASGLSAIVTCDTCALTIGGSSTLAKIALGSTNTGASATVTLKDTTMQFAATGQALSYNDGIFEWYNTSSYAGASNVTGATVPTNFIIGGVNGTLYGHGLDLTGITGNIFNVSSGAGRTYLYDCKLASGVTLPSGALSQGQTYFSADNCDDTANNRNYRFLRATPQGGTTQNVQIVRTNGATDGTTPIAWQATSGGGASVNSPLQLPTIVKRYNTTGSPLTFTLPYILNAASGLTNAQIWTGLEVLTASTSPISSVTTNRVANLLNNTAASTVTTDTSCWDSAVPQRQNSTAYTTGQVIGVSSNTCRIFFALGSGTSAGSLPAGYATAVDGGTVVDGSVNFRAGFRQQLQVTVTPQKAGYVLAVPYLAVTNTTIYLDPKLQP